jgi:luciferase-like monooxygenase
VKRPSEKDEEVEWASVSPETRKLIELTTERLLAFAETTVREEEGRRYFFVRGHEFAAIVIQHGKALVDVRAPRPGSIGDSRVVGLKQLMHEGAHREGWVYVPLESEDDVRAVIELAGLGYEEIVGSAPTIAVRKERPLETFGKAGASANAPKAKKGKAAKK